MHLFDCPIVFYTQFLSIVHISTTYGVVMQNMLNKCIQTSPTVEYHELYPPFLLIPLLGVDSLVKNYTPNSIYTISS